MTRPTSYLYTLQWFEEVEGHRRVPYAQQVFLEDEATAIGTWKRARQLSWAQPTYIDASVSDLYRITYFESGAPKREIIRHIDPPQGRAA